MTDLNPYRDWLGIETTGKPTYYQLLGLSPQDVTPETVQERTAELLQVLRSCNDAAQHHQQRSQIVTRIKRAAACLSNERRRADYDLKLRDHIKHLSLRQSELTAGNRPVAAPPKTAREPAAQVNAQCQPEASGQVSEQQNLGLAETQPVSPGTQRSNIARKLKKRQTVIRVWWLCACLAVMCLAGLGFLFATQTELGKSMLTRLPQPNSVTEQDASVAETAAALSPEEPRGTDERNVDVKHQGDGAGETEDEEEGTADPQRDARIRERPNPTEPTSTHSKTGPSPEERKQLGSLLSRVKEAITQRELELARTQLSKAQTLPARLEDKAKLKRLVVLHDSVTKYWNGMKSELKRIKSGNEIQVNDTRVIVVEKTDRQLTIRVAGKNRTYPIDKLPLDLAIGLAERWLRPDEPSTHVFRGAMMATTPNKYSKEDAKSEWQKARLAGGIELNDLELVLDDDYELRP